MPSGAVARFAEFLQAQDFRFTPARKKVLEEVFDTHGHFEAEDIVMSLRGKKSGVSRATVYRTLPLLVESGLLREVDSAEKHSHYEHTFGHEHHDHLICMECGRTIEFYDKRIEALQVQVCGRLNFKPSAHKLEIMGTCEDCARRMAD